MKLVLSDDDVNKSLDDAANGDEVTSSENTSTEVQGTYGLTCLTTIDNKGYQKKLMFDLATNVYTNLAGYQEKKLTKSQNLNLITS